MPIVRVNDVNLHYDEFGKGEEVIIFSHGYLMNSTMFNGQIDILKEHFRCIAFDMRGHGKSESTTGGYELDNLVTDAISFMEELNLSKVHFVGMSTGGFVGMRLAIRNQNLLKSLVLMDTSAEQEIPKAIKNNMVMLWIVKNIGWFPVIGKVMSILFHSTFLKDPARKEEKKKWQRIISGQNKKGIVPFGKSIFMRDSVLDQLADVTIPTAVIVGANDESTPPVFSMNMLDKLPNAEGYTIPDSGHSAAVEKPIEMADALKSFYQKNGILA